MAYSAVGIIVYLYSLFSPYRIAEYISANIPQELTYAQMAFVFVLAAALLIGKRRTLNALLLLFGAFEGYVLASFILPHISVGPETALAATLISMGAVAYLVYKAARFAISAYLALLLGTAYIALVGQAATAPLVTVAAFVAAFIFYRYIASVVAALLGSALLLLFLIELNIPGFAPYLISASAFALSILVRYAASRVTEGRARAARRARLNRMRN